VIRLSEVSVLVIKKETMKLKREQFVIKSDFLKEIRKTLQKTPIYAENFNIKLSLVIILMPNNFKTNTLAEKIMNNFVAKFTINNHSITNYNNINIENGIINFSKKI
jgi:hypothetical protein